MSNIVSWLDLCTFQSRTAFLDKVIVWILFLDLCFLRYSFLLFVLTNSILLSFQVILGKQEKRLPIWKSSGINIYKSSLYKLVLKVL